MTDFNKEAEKFLYQAETELQNPNEAETLVSHEMLQEAEEEQELISEDFLISGGQYNNYFMIEEAPQVNFESELHSLQTVLTDQKSCHPKYRKAAWHQSYQPTSKFYLFKMYVAVLRFWKYMEKINKIFTKQYFGKQGSSNEDGKQIGISTAFGQEIVFSNFVERRYYFDSDY